MKKNVLYLFAILMLFTCSSNNDINEPSNSAGNNNGNTAGNNGGGTEEWLIPINEVKDGGPGKDGIPSIENPKFIDAQNQNFLNDDDLVIGVNYNGETKAYPHGILNWHEIVNDKFNNESITINYCPLTGTAFGWESMTNGAPSTFGVSGLLYLANLILYDRNTDSYWSQMLLQCVSGDLIGDFPETINVVETNWLTWKTLYPNTNILSRDTNFYDAERYDM